MNFIFNKKILILFSIIVVFLFASKLVFAVWSGTFYEPGDTLNPECSPTDTDCDVRPPLTSLNINDTAYGVSWDGDTTHAPSKNAVYDQMEVLAVGGHDPLTLGTANGLSLATQVLSLALASTSTTGALSDTDWDTFNNKQDALISGTNIKTINGSSVLGSGDISTVQDLSGYIPYTGGTSNVDLGVHNLTVDTNSLFVDSVNHRVGIGTTSPGAKLDVASNSGVRAGQFSQATLGVGSSALQAYDGVYSFNIGYATTGKGSNYWHLFRNSSNTYYDQSSGSHNFQVGGSTYLTVDSTGNVGIGTTNPTSGKLVVSGGNVTTDARFKINNGSDRLEVKYSGGVTSIGSVQAEDFAIITGDTNQRIRVQASTGNVGIGTTSPTSKIHGVATLSAATGDEVAYSLDYTVNKATSGNDTGLQINMTDTASPGTSRLLSLNVGGSNKAYISSGGALSITDSLYTPHLQGVQGAANNYTIDINSRSFSTADRFAVIIGNGTHSQTSGTNGALKITPTYNQVASTAANTDLLISRTETAIGSGAQYLIDAQVGGSSKFSVSRLGQITGYNIVAGSDSSYLYSVNLNASGQYAIAADVSVARVGAAVMKITDGSTNLGSLNMLKLGISESTGATYYTYFQGGDQSANITYTLPTGTPASDGYVLSSTTAGVMSWTAPSGGISGSGTTDYLAKWTGTSSLGSSAIIDSGGNIGIGGSAGYKLDVHGTVNLRGSASTQGIFVSSDGRVHLGGTNPTQAKLQMTNGDNTRHMFWMEDGGNTYSVVGRMKTTSDSSNTVIEMQDGSSGQARSGGINFLDSSASLIGQLGFVNSSTSTSRLIKISAGSTYVQAKGDNNITLYGSTTATSASASIVSLIAKGASSQTANLFEAQNSSGTVLTMIDETGNLGIGTSGPTSRLHGVTTLSADTGDEVAYSLDYTVNKATSGNDTGLQINMTDTASPGTSYGINYRVGGSSQFSVTNAGVIQQKGCTTAGTLSADTSGNIICTPSSERFKEDIVNLPDSLSKLMMLRPVSYVFDSEMNMGNDLHFGFISEEVALISPELATHDSFGNPYGLDTNAILATTVKAIQEMNLNLEGIAGNVEISSSNTSFVTAFFDNLKMTIGTWLADAGNGIVNIFAGEVNTKMLCVSNDAGEETCLTKAQLDALLADVIVSEDSSGEGDLSPEISVCVEPQILVDGVCSDPAPAETKPEVPVCVEPQVLIDGVCADPTSEETVSPTETTSEASTEPASDEPIIEPESNEPAPETLVESTL